MRHFLILAGSAAWCRTRAAQLLANRPGVVWIGDVAGKQQLDRVIPANQAKQLLGQEFHSILFDAHCGFDADAFAAVSGTIKNHGYLLLLTPPLHQWPAFKDPDYQRLCVWPVTADKINGRFLQRLSSMFLHTPAAEVITQEESHGSAPLSSPVTSTTASTADQQQAIDAIVHVAGGHRSRPLVITADRGRGKSTALGLAAAILLNRHEHFRYHIVVTAPAMNAVATLFQHAAPELPGFNSDTGKLFTRDRSLRFVAPDQLLKQHKIADILFVDEAAAIPAPLLEALLQRYKRTVFSTTVHGYEGSGRGFAIRFRDTLDRLTPQWRELRLSTPIRWDPNDPLERLTFDAFLMNAEPADDNAFAEFTPDQLEISRITRDTLLQDEQTLRQIFGLLVLAHYRTRPFDLRYLLDGANVEILLGRYRGEIAAVAVAVREGGFDDAMMSQILSGKRRPHGHLAPQTLALHCAQPQALQHNFLRIMRIAVHPAIRREGVASALLKELCSSTKGIDTLCTSFGATSDLLALWRKNRFQPVRIGLKREASSGCHSLLMLHPLTDNGRQLLHQAQERFLKQLPLLLTDSLNKLESGIFLPLLQNAMHSSDVSSQSDELLRRFAAAQLPFDAVFPELVELAIWAARSGNAARLNDQQQDLFFSRVLQRETIQSLAARLQLAGKREVQRSLQHAVKKLLCE
ncbi:MAG: tRNA(Met) cytidine acetyltransferase [Gammaproteobacteria bacterium]|nr:tRNA(Met) cytidine acetyltransferase [Gammaproteobacteria bacterium]